MQNGITSRIYQAWSRRGSWENPEGYAHQAVTQAVLSSARRRWWGERPTAELPEPKRARFGHVDTGRRRAGCVASGLADVAGEAALSGRCWARSPGHARGRGRGGDATSGRERASLTSRGPQALRSQLGESSEVNSRGRRCHEPARTRNCGGGLPIWRSRRARGNLLPAVLRQIPHAEPRHRRALPGEGRAAALPAAAVVITLVVGIALAMHMCQRPAPQDGPASNKADHAVTGPPSLRGVGGFAGSGCAPSRQYPAGTPALPLLS